MWLPVFQEISGLHIFSLNLWFTLHFFNSVFEEQWQLIFVLFSFCGLPFLHMGIQFPPTSGKDCLFCIKLLLHLCRISIGHIKWVYF